MSDELSIRSDIIKELIEFYDEDLRPHLAFTAQEEKKIIKYVNKITCGSISFASLICTGGMKCVYKHTCPLRNKEPLGHPCPFEQLLAQRWYDEYSKSLDIDINDKTERTQITELVEADILNARANAMLAADGLVMENAVGIEADTGNVVYRKEEHIALSVKQKAQLRRDKILRAFIATRESKVRATKGSIQDPTVYYAKLRETMEKMQQKHETIEAQTVEVTNEPIKNTDAETSSGNK